MHTSLPSENPVVSLDVAKAFLSFGGFHTQGFSGYLVRAASEKNVKNPAVSPLAAKMHNLYTG